MQTGKIMTVTGEMQPDASLFYQSHEHLMIGDGKAGEINPALVFHDFEKSLDELKSYAKAGGGGLTDAQPGGCGRMTRELRNLSIQSGVRIIASTGFHKLSFYPENHWIFTAGQEMLTDFFLRELKEGMFVDADTHLPSEESDICAGQIKTALETTKITPQYEKLFLAAAAAAKESGAPVMVHVEIGTNPLPYFDLLMREGVKAEQMIFCHLDRACPDIGIHKELARNGAFLEYDTIARKKYHSDEEELKIFEQMVSAGYSDQLLFSLDTTKERLKAYGGKIGLDYILETFIQKMRDAGFTEDVIESISRKNPARAFSWQN